jgi:hypothetical protein
LLEAAQHVQLQTTVDKQIPTNQPATEIKLWELACLRLRSIRLYFST